MGGFSEEGKAGTKSLSLLRFHHSLDMFPLPRRHLWVGRGEHPLLGISLGSADFPGPYTGTQCCSLTADFCGLLKECRMSMNELHLKL